MKGGAAVEMLTTMFQLGEAFFKVLFAVPVLGVLFLLGTLGPVIIKAVKHR